MAVPEQTPYIEHTGNGVTTSFSLGFQCESKDHLIVLVDEIEPPIASWSLGGGNVVFTTAPAAGTKITLQRNTPFGRTTDYQSLNNSFRPQTVNGDFDRLWLKLQELGVADWLMKLYVDRLHREQKEYIDQKDDELKNYLIEEIRKQGVALDQLEDYYNYLMERLAQIAVDKGWEAGFVVDASGKTQQQINDAAATKFGRLRDTYDLMTDSRIQDVKDGVPSFDAASIIQNLITGSDETTLTINSGTYFTGPTGIQFTGVQDKKIIFEKGVVFKWHPLVVFSTNVRMFSLTDCENITFDEMVLRGANNPAVWVKTESVIRAGLTDKQTGVLLVNCKRITFNAPDIQNFQWGIYTSSTGVNKSSNIEIKGGYFSGNYCGITWESYLIDGITDCKVENTASKENWKWGMWMEAGDLSKDSRYIKRIKVTGGEFSGQVEEHGVYVQGQEHSFIGVDFISNNTAGLRMLACGQLHVVGCKFNDNGWNRNGIGYLAGAAFIGSDTSTTDVNKRSNSVIFSDNISIENRFTFIDYKLDNGVIVSNNTCHNNGAAGVEGDIVFRSNQNSKISNNIIHDSKCDVGILVRDQGNSESKNIDVDDNIVTGQAGIGIKYQWDASETDSEMIRIRGNTVKGSTSHGILVELNTRETKFVEITGNNTQYNGGDGIKTYLAATAECMFMRVTDNSSTLNTGYGLNFNGVSGGTVYGLLEKNNHVQRNNSSGVQIFRPASGSASYGTNQLVASGMRRTVTFSLKDVAVAASGEIQLKLDGVIPYGRNSASVRVKAIEFFSSKSLTGGSLSATVRSYTGVGTGNNMLSELLTTTITSGNQDKSVTNAMNSSSDRILLSTKYYVGVDMNNPVVAGGGTVDLLCNIILDYSDDWRFEVAL